MKTVVEHVVRAVGSHFDAKSQIREDFDLDRELLVAQCAPSSPPLATCHTLVIALGQAVCYRQLRLATWHAMVTPWPCRMPSSPHLPLVTRGNPPTHPLPLVTRV